MVNHQLFLLLTLISSILVFQSESRVKAKASFGFSLELIHRDSPLSPFYNASLNSSEILTKNAIHSMERFRHFQSLINQKAVQSIVFPTENSYLTKLSFGTPPVEYFAIVDTGSDLTWIQCVPCTECYNSQGSSLFDPQASSTYKAFSCDSQTCRAFGGEQCLKTNDCQYHVTYGDMSSTTGILSSDSLSFDSINGQKTTFSTSIFGCGRNNQVQLGNLGIAGIVGLGGGPFSLVSQIGPQIDHRFSYCFVPRFAKSSGKLIFGQESIISHPKAISTPLVSKYPQTFYYLTLNGVSIGDQTAHPSSTQGNVLIDSGVTLTILEPDLYSSVEAMVKEAIGKEPVQDPSGAFNLCYGADTNINVPEMVFHFSGADVRLQPVNTFMVNGDLVCMVIVPNSVNPFSVFGNYAQINFQVEYDLQKRVVSFAPTDCTQI
ncbi:hypothetical protein Goari_010308 [Gossypium aridum]|uniref:Peptidase A1 domain-containing protein n=1 Tax=Gossypium aridum TaxID=34290 RepID=A0A7J8XZL2_GOSAI|nr:hypothetical protein [Gossypium aridum]